MSSTIISSSGLNLTAPLSTTFAVDNLISFVSGSGILNVETSALQTQTIGTGITDFGFGGLVSGFTTGDEVILQNIGGEIPGYFSDTNTLDASTIAQLFSFLPTIEAKYGDEILTVSSAGAVTDNLNFTSGTLFGVKGPAWLGPDFQAFGHNVEEMLFGDASQSSSLYITLTPNPFDTAQVIAEVSSSGPMVDQTAICYLRGTRIATADGEKAIEELQIGDMVVSRFGGLQPVRWIGRQTFAKTFVKNNRAQIPVHIRAGALGGGVPARDLFVSPGHSMLVGGVLVLAHNLVNGITITQDVCPETLEYFNLELGRHDCVRAEGAWSESFADGPSLRAKFHNAAEYLEMHPEYEAPDQLSALCAPRPEAGPELARALEPVLAYAAGFLNGTGRGVGEMEGWVDEVTSTHITGWAMDTAYPELPVLLEIWSGGALLGTTLACNYRQDLEKAGKGAGRCAFSFALQAPLTGQPPIVRRANTAQLLHQTEDCQKMMAAA